jgi:hypothetical protein
VGIQWEIVEKCFATNMGTQLQLSAEKQQTETLQNIKFVPTIVYAGVSSVFGENERVQIMIYFSNSQHFNQALQDRSQYDFKNVLCELLDDAAPVCQ